MSKNKTLLIAGGKSDIAIAVAYKFAAKGFDIYLAGRNVKVLENHANDLKIRFEITVSLIEFDILQVNNHKSSIASLKVMPDIVLCAVGLLGEQKSSQKDMNLTKSIIRTNFEGPALFLSEIANLFEKRGYGTIIGISSVAGERGRASNYTYGSAKAAFSTFLSGLRNRLFSSNVNVLTVLPGFVNTKMTQGMKLPTLITASTQKVAELIYKNRNKSKIIFIGPWRLIMLIIKLIPNYIFKRLNL